MVATTCWTVRSSRTWRLRCNATQPTPSTLHLYVLEGYFIVHTESEMVVLRVGEAFRMPLGTAVVSGPQGARGLVVASPSGFVRLVHEAGTPAESNSIPPITSPDMEAFGRASLEIGDELVWSPPTAG